LQTCSGAKTRTGHLGTGVDVVITVFDDYRRLSAIFGDFRRFSAIFGDFRRFSAIFGDYRRFSAIFSDKIDLVLKIDTYIHVNNSIPFFGKNIFTIIILVPVVKTKLRFGTGKARPKLARFGTEAVLYQPYANELA
jgi:hypothetical protein